MKKYFLLQIICIGLLLVSCDLDRFPLNGPTTGTFPASEDEAVMGLLAAYKGLTEPDAASTHYLHVVDNITDIGYTRPGTNYTSPITSSLTTDNALAIKPWRVHYKTIARVHTVLDNLENIKSQINEERYLLLNAELRVIRAYSYSKLIEYYGDVPLVLEALSLDNVDLPRTSKEDIQMWIIDEMTDVADNLPVSQATFGNVRASRITAYMLKARLALYSKQFELAAATAQKAIELSKGTHELTPFNSSVNFVNRSHEAGEPDPSNIFGYDGYRNSKEWIWVSEFNQSIAGNTHNQGYYMASRLGKGAAYWGPTQNLIDAYQSIDGLPITESPLYDENNPFENRDPRLDMYSARPGSRLMGFQFEINNNFSRVYNYWPVVNGTSATPSLVTNTDATNAYRSFSGYYWRKHSDNKDYETNSSRGVSDMNVGIFRYAELLLIYAEAKIESNNIDNTVYDAINQIRHRAGMPSLPTGLSQEEMRKALRYERKVELSNEGLRWYDLRRWGIAQNVMNGYLYLNRAGNGWPLKVIDKFDENHNPIYNHEEAIKCFNTQEVVFRANKDEYWPIPQQEMDVNPNLVQNPGY